MDCLETTLTSGLSGVETNEKANNASNQKRKSNKVELADMLPESPALMRVQVQEEEQDGERDAACGQIDEEAPRAFSFSTIFLRQKSCGLTSATRRGL